MGRWSLQRTCCKISQSVYYQHLNVPAGGSECLLQSKMIKRVLPVVLIALLSAFLACVDSGIVAGKAHIQQSGRKSSKAKKQSSTKKADAAPAKSDSAGQQQDASGKGTAPDQSGDKTKDPAPQDKQQSSPNSDQKPEAAKDAQKDTPAENQAQPTAAQTAVDDAALKKRLAPIEALRPDSSDSEFRKVLNDDDWYVRGEGAILVARFKKKLSSDDVAPLLSDKSWFVRNAAIDAVALTGTDSAGAALIKLLDPSDSFVCARAAAALGTMKYAPAAEPLTKLLSDNSSAVKRAAASALGELKAQSAIEPLRPLLKDNDPAVRAAAAEVLGKLGDKDSAAPIDASVKDAGDAAWVYAIASYRLGAHEHLDLVLDALKSPYDDIRFPALKAVAEFNDPASIPALVDLTKSVDPPPGPPSANSRDSDIAFRVELARALGGFHDPRASAALTSLLSDPQPVVRANAVEAIAASGSNGKPGVSGADESSVKAVFGLLKDEQSPLVLSAIDKSIKSFDRRQTEDALLDSLKSGANVRQMLTDLGVTPDAEAVKLDTGTAEEKVRAVEVMSRLGDHKAVDPLIKALENAKDSTLRARIVQALGAFRDRSTEQALMDASRDPEPGIRAAAISSLGQLGDSGVTGTLFDATRDSSPEVRDAAFRSLGLLGISVERLSADVTNPDFQTRLTAISELSRLRDPRAVPVVITALKDSDERVRTEAARSLAVFADERAVDPLIASLSDSSANVRAQSAAALGLFKSHKALGPLEKALADRDARVSGAAAESLARMEDPEAIHMLIGSLSSPDWQLRARAAQVLMRVPGAAGSPDAIPRLVRGLQDKDLIVRYYSAEALVAAGQPAVDQIVALFRAGRYIERERAGRVLGRIGKPSLQPMLDIVQDRSVQPELRAAAAAVLGIIGDQVAVDSLISLLRDQRYFVRQQSAVALGRIGAPAIDALVKESRSSTPVVRESVIVALGDACSEIRHEIDARGGERPDDKTNIARCVEAIQHSLDDSNPSVRLAAVQALGQTGSKSAIDPLMSILRDENNSMRGEAAVSLGKIGEPAEQVLITALNDPKPLTRKLVAEALGDIRSQAAVPALMQLVSSDMSGARAEAIQALGKIGDTRAVDVIITAMSDASSNVKVNAIQALAALQGPKVEGALDRALGDREEDVRQAAATGLAEVGTEKSILALEKIADDDSSSEVRSAAVKAIEKLQARKNLKPPVKTSQQQ